MGRSRSKAPLTRGIFTILAMEFYLVVMFFISQCQLCIHLVWFKSLPNLVTE
jgi:hypothetical protein